jgi:hypothetical protein
LKRRGSFIHLEEPRGFHGGAGDSC